MPTAVTSTPVASTSVTNTPVTSTSLTSTSLISTSVASTSVTSAPGVSVTPPLSKCAYPYPDCKGQSTYESDNTIVGLSLALAIFIAVTIFAAVTLAVYFRQRRQASSQTHTDEERIIGHALDQVTRKKTNASTRSKAADSMWSEHTARSGFQSQRGRAWYGRDGPMETCASASIAGRENSPVEWI